MHVEPDELPQAGSGFRAMLELLRLPNVFTAIADVMMGFLVVQGTFEPYTTLGLLVATSCCLYLAGMVFNDVFDRQIDAVERPQRPIPSGRISLGAARLIGAVLFCVGLVLPMQVSWQLNLAMPFTVAWSLALLIILYDKWLKHTPIGPVAMGGCRMLNVFLGMSFMTDAPSAMHWLIAGGVGVYVMGITVFARGEVAISNRGRLIAGIVVMLSGMAMLAVSPMFIGENQEWRLAGVPGSWNLFWLLIGAQIFWRTSRAVAVPNARLVQSAVKTSILSLIVIDAAASVPLSALGLIQPMIILLLLIPATFIGRWIYST
jgi:4-hydroxybenzoate polyprenyltransferase